MAEAKKRLLKAESELLAVKDVLRKAEEAVPVDAQRVSEAEWQAALGDEKAVFLDSFKMAQESFRTANMAFQKAIDATTAAPQQGKLSQPNKTEQPRRS